MDRHRSSVALSVMRTPIAVPPRQNARKKMQQRRRFKQTLSLQQRLNQEAQRLLAEAGLLPPGPVRDAVLTRIREAEATAQLDNWLKRPDAQPSVSDKSPHG